MRVMEVGVVLKRYWWVLLVGVGLVWWGWGEFGFSSKIGQSGNLESGEVVNDVKLALEKEGAKLDLSELLDGCPRRDCIPSIDEPVFESIVGADEWLVESDRVFILRLDNEVRGYPQRIMNWHEIVNDWFLVGEEKRPIAVTFCPLCGTATAFERKVNGVVTEFGVSGKLHNSDLVMYDRFEGSLWQQVTGEAIVGPAARRDEELEPLFLVTLAWSEVKDRYDEIMVLSRDTGFSRDYDLYPYGSYEQDSRVLFPVGDGDERLHPKTWVYGLVINDEAKAYLEEEILSGNGFVDLVGGVSVRAVNEDGVVSFERVDNGEEIAPLRSFWFAWVAFNPGTGLYERGGDNK